MDSDTGCLYLIGKPSECHKYEYYIAHLKTTGILILFLMVFSVDNIKINPRLSLFIHQQSSWVTAFLLCTFAVETSMCWKMIRPRTFFVETSLSWKIIRPPEIWLWSSLSKYQNSFGYSSSGMAFFQIKNTPWWSLLFHKQSSWVTTVFLFMDICHQNTPVLKNIMDAINIRMIICTLWLK